MVVLRRGHWHAFVIAPLVLMKQLGQPAAAAKVDAELVKQATVEEVVLLFHL